MKQFFLILTLGAILLYGEEDSTLGKRGGAFFFSPGYSFLGLDPIKDLTKNEPALKPYHFDFGSNGILMQGFGAYWGRKNSARFGFAVTGGYRTWQSDKARVPLRDSDGSVELDTNAARDTLYSDSVQNLMLIPATLSFLFEKSRSMGNWNLYAGGSLGFGALVVIKDNDPAEENSAFSDRPMDSMDPDSMHNGHGRSGDVAVALFNTVEARAGATYSLAPWLHVGGEGTAGFLFSQSGFIGGRGDSFTSFNPGFRLRIVLGNLG